MNKFSSKVGYSNRLFSNLVLFYGITKRRDIRERLKWNVLLWSILAICNLIDILVSWHVISEGAKEANPLMDFFYSKFGSISFAFIKGALLGMLLMLLPFIKEGLQKLLLFACTVYILLMFSHLIRFI